MKLRRLLLMLLLLVAGRGWCQLVVNEIMTSNLDVCLDPSWNYGGWVEFCNTGTEDIALQGLYLSDDPANPFLFPLPASAGTIPAHGFGCIWFDHHDIYRAAWQVPFKMDAEGGTLYLSDAQGHPVLTIDYPPATPRCSWARTVDVTGDWSWTATPTPAASNASSAFATQQAEAPIVTPNSQLFTDPLSVSLSWPEEYTIRYTTDGSVPTETNGTVLNPHSFMVSTTTVYRFRAFCPGLLPSDVVTRSYLHLDHNYRIPVLSVVADAEDLYGSDHGLFGKGPHGRPGRGDDEPCNWNMDWERAAHVELLNGARCLLSQEADIAPSGGWSRNWDPTPFKIIASDLYGTPNYFPYTLFEQKPYIRNKSFRARNGGNDWYDRYRDAALQMMVGRSGLNIDYQEYQPVQHYVNGVYKGVINLREPNNKHFVRSNHGWEEEEIDMFKIEPDSGYIQMNGDRESFDRWCQLASRCGKDEAAYDELTAMVDVEEMAYYLAMEFYLANGDWPYNNVKAFRPRTEDGKWRFVVYDLDGCLSISDVFTHFEQYRKSKCPVVQLTLDMLKNARFRQLFTDAFCVVAGSVFEPTRCRAIADAINDMTWSEIHYEGKIPSYSYNLVKNSLTAQRQTQMVDEMRTYLKLTKQPTMTVDVRMAIEGDTKGASDAVPGRLLYNDLPIPTGALSGRVVAPVTLRAEAAPGYELVAWHVVDGDVEQQLFAKGSNWRYYDEGSLDGVRWQDATYDDGAWRRGPTPLGYNASNSGVATRLDYGSRDNRRPTYYMRTKVNVSNPAHGTFTLNYSSDDGVIVYVNGREALRYRMPEGPATYATFSASKSLGNPDKNRVTLDASLFIPGENVIAVELHNHAANDDDVYWDAALTIQRHYTDSERLLSTDPSLTLPEGTDITLEALFAAVSAPSDAMPLRINEVSASNDIYVNDYWKRNDWIEIYNTSATAVDLAGMYLSDDPSTPLKYQISPISVTASTAAAGGTVVPAHGHVVVWCDKQAPVTQLHADFKLSADSGYVVLTRFEGGPADTLRYCRQERDMTVGRYPDGGDAVYAMYRPTIGKANTVTLCDTLHTQLHLVPTAIGELSEPTPTVVVTEYLTLGGIVVATPSPGIYIRRETLSDGTVRAQKIIIR